MRLDDIHKRFGSVRALQGSTLSLRPGEVHAVLGENGAGKTTLLRVLAGLSSPDRGELLIAGQPTRFRTSRDAWSAGIGLVHQHFTLVPRFTVLENLALGVRWSARGLGLPLHRVRRQVERLTEATGLRVSLEAPVEALGVGERQRVEILKVLLRETSVLALDEPTAVLTPGEVSSLLTLLRSLAVEGRTVVLVAHKLDEVLSVADHVTVLRAGRTVLEAPRANIDAATLARAMVGEEHAVASRRSVGRPERGSGEGSGSGTPDETVARLDNVTFVGRRGEPALQQVDLEVRKGEIVGIAGVEGNGQRELALVLAGRVAVEGGSVALPPDPGFIPQDRAHGGLVPDFDLAENIALALHRSKHWRRGPLLDWRGLRAMKFRTWAPAGDGTYFSRELPGPSTPQQWEAAWDLFTVAAIMLDIASPMILDRCKKHIKALVTEWADCWHLIALADDKMRAEQWERIRRQIVNEIDGGTVAPPPGGPAPNLGVRLCVGPLSTTRSGTSRSGTRPRPGSRAADEERRLRRTNASRTPCCPEVGPLSRRPLANRPGA